MGNCLKNIQPTTTTTTTRIPLWGVSLKYILQEFEEELLGNHDFNVVCEKVKRKTRSLPSSNNKSFAAYLLDNPETKKYVKNKANVFVSYAWLGSFKETMNALQHHFMKNENVFVWMDFLCVDQHKTSDLNFKDWSEVFQTSLKEIGKAVIVVVPAEKPIVPTRAWCCFEMTQIVKANISYNICISPSDTEKLIRNMKSGMEFDKWNDLFSLINVEKSIATKASDQVAILKLIRDIGVIQVNNVVADALKNLYVKVASVAEKESKGLELVRVLTARAHLHKAKGEFNESSIFYDKANKIAANLPNNENGIATTVNNLAQALRDKGKYGEAEELAKEALEIRRRKLGDDDPEVAQSINNIAVLFTEQGKFEEAEEYYREAIDILGNINVEGDQATVATLLSNFALFLSNLGRYDEAEPLYHQSFEIRKRTLGEDHPDVAQSLNSLAELFRVQDKLDEAEHHYHQSLAITKKTLGEKHPTYAECLNNLALLLKSKKNYPQAEKNQRQALEIDKMVFGENHPNVARDLNNLARILESQNNFTEAERLFRQSIAIGEKTNSLGMDHATRLNNYAQFLKSRGQLTQAEKFQRQALAIDKSLFGDNHINVAIDLHNLAELLKATPGNEIEAKTLGRQAYLIAKKQLGIDHPTSKNFQQWENF